MNIPPYEQDPSVAEWLKNHPEREAEVTLSVVVPAYNEERRLPPTLIDMIDFLDAHIPSYEIIVVDDGSRDHTVDVVRKFEKIRSNIKLIRLARNMGKGHAVRLGVLNAHGARIVFADADGATPIEELPKLNAAMDGGAAIAIGSRAAASTTTTVHTTWLRKYPGRIFNFFVNSVVLPGIADTQCGFKMFSKESARKIFPHQTADRFSFDVEVLYIAKRLGLSIAEVPVNWTNIPGSKVNVIWDGIKMLRDIFIFRWRHRKL